MPDWAIHLIVPLLALLLAGRKEDYKYIFLLLPLAVISDTDTFATQHRALLHNRWRNAYGYIVDSIGTGALAFVLLAGAYATWRKG